MKKTKLLFILLLTLVLGFAVVQPLNANAVEADQTNNHIQYYSVRSCHCCLKEEWPRPKR